MDLMSEVIRTVRVGSANAQMIRLSGSRGIRFPKFARSGFHFIKHGACWLITDDREPVALNPGDVVLMTSGADHGLSRVPCTLEELPLAVMAPRPIEPGPFDFEFLCGGYSLAHGQMPRYLAALPDLIAVSPDYERHPEMRILIELLSADLTGEQAGTGATVPALLDLVLVHVLREWHEQCGPDSCPEPDDAAIAAALRELHTNPQERWTVARLSEAAGLPRTAFSRRFSAVVGQPPIRYLISWRLGRAAQLLRETDAPQAAIARQVGYSTEFAFAGAFRREFGVSPGRFRRTPTSGIVDEQVL